MLLESGSLGVADHNCKDGDTELDQSFLSRDVLEVAPVCDGPWSMIVKKGQSTVGDGIVLFRPMLVRRPILPNKFDEVPIMRIQGEVLRGQVSRDVV